MKSKMRRIQTEGEVERTLEKAVFHWSLWAAVVNCVDQHRCLQSQTFTSFVSPSQGQECVKYLQLKIKVTWGAKPGFSHWGVSSSSDYQHHPTSNVLRTQEIYLRIHMGLLEHEGPDPSNSIHDCDKAVSWEHLDCQLSGRKGQPRVFCSSLIILSMLICPFYPVLCSSYSFWPTKVSVRTLSQRICTDMQVCLL